ncbi:hypothetical protein PUN28_017019 [Cardiocondyla obscurior]|uniref:Uncharacterized protein n=1 Tax=Cardiocondyla obscurior TaxID=286306 RepID=A0AAW2EM19_9HYME
MSANGLASAGFRMRECERERVDHVSDGMRRPLPEKFWFCVRLGHLYICLALAQGKLLKKYECVSRGMYVASAHIAIVAACVYCERNFLVYIYLSFRVSLFVALSFSFIGFRHIPKIFYFFSE